MRDGRHRESLHCDWDSGCGGGASDAIDGRFSCLAPCPAVMTGGNRQKVNECGAHLPLETVRRICPRDGAFLAAHVCARSPQRRFRYLRSVGDCDDDRGTGTAHGNEIGFSISMPTELATSTLKSTAGGGLPEVLGSCWTKC